MIKRIHKDPNSSKAFYFEIEYDLNLIKKVNVEFFSEEEAQWKPITFTLNPNLSNGLGIYEFFSPVGSYLKLLIHPGPNLTLLNKKDSKILYNFLDKDSQITQSKSEYCRAVFEKKFHDTHSLKLENDQSGCFSFFYSCFIKTKVKPHWNLTRILNHASHDDNRSRQICKSLGWMNADGSFTEKGLILQDSCKLNNSFSLSI